MPRKCPVSESILLEDHWFQLAPASEANSRSPGYPHPRLWRFKCETIGLQSTPGTGINGNPFFARQPDPNLQANDPEVLGDIPKHRFQDFHFSSLVAFANSRARSVKSSISAMNDSKDKRL